MTFSFFIALLFFPPHFLLFSFLFLLFAYFFILFFVLFHNFLFLFIILQSNAFPTELFQPEVFLILIIFLSSLS